MSSVREYIMREAAKHTMQYGKAPDFMALPYDMFDNFVKEMGTLTYTTAPFTEYRIYTQEGSVIITRDSYSNSIQKQFDQDLEDILDG